MSQPSLADVIQSHIDAFAGNLYTSLPATIISIENLTTECTIDVKPIINKTFSDGKSSEMPTIYSVPVQYPAGGGAVMTFPLAVGDDVLLVFSMKSLDEAMEVAEGTVDVYDRRMHHLTDAIAIPSVFRTPNSPSPSKSHVELKFGTSVFRMSNNNGDIDISTASNVNITCTNANVTATTKVDITSPAVDISGDLTVDGTIHAGTAITSDGDVTADNDGSAVGLLTHTHEYTDTSTSSSYSIDKDTTAPNAPS